MFGTLAPFVVSGLIFAAIYLFARWREVVAVAKYERARADALTALVEAMQEEGCAAMGALQNIFNGVTAGGMPHSKLVKKVADVAADVLVFPAPCEHKEEVDELREAVVVVQDEADNLAGELMVARLNAENWQNLAVESEARAEEAEHLLGVANERLIVERSQKVTCCDFLPFRAQERD